jgi:hypothetical protein
VPIQIPSARYFSLGADLVDHTVRSAILDLDTREGTRHSRSTAKILHVQADPVPLGISCSAFGQGIVPLLGHRQSSRSCRLLTPHKMMLAVSHLDEPRIRPKSEADSRRKTIVNRYCS